MNKAIFSFPHVATFLLGLVCFSDSASAQDCCQPAPRMRLSLVDTERDLPRLKFDCVTDDCGCSRRSVGLTSETIPGKKLGWVPVDPCRRGFLSRLRGN